MRERDVKLHASLPAYVLHVCALPQALSLLLRMSEKVGAADCIG